MSEGIYFENLTTLSLYGSSVTSLGTDIEGDVFDASRFNRLDGGIAGLRRVQSFNATTGVPTSYSAFVFYNTKIQNIDGINWNGSGANLFRDCFTFLVYLDNFIYKTAQIIYFIGAGSYQKYHKP